MIEELFLPLDRHFDDGLYATAEAFKDGAEKLSGGDEGKSSFVNGHLPINFLFRHSVELYLKSIIVTIHRALTLPTADSAHTPDPKVKDGAKWRPLTRIHSVKTLLTELDRLVTENRPAMDRLDASDWTVPDELRGWIDTIEAHDSGSTFSRYPRSGSPAESMKSGFGPVDAAKFIAEMNERKEGKPGKFLLALTDDDGAVVGAFAPRANPVSAFREAIVKASQMLSGAAFGIRAELVEGLGRKRKEWRAEKLQKAASKKVKRKAPRRSTATKKKPKKRRKR